MTAAIVTGRQLICVAAVLVMIVAPLMLPTDCAVYPVQKLEKTERSWPMFGGSPSRNMVNTVERNIPGDWCVEESKRKNVRWMAELGNRTLGSPAVALGRVFVTTNNASPRDPKVKGPKVVLMAFRETDGQFLWQIAHDPGPSRGHFPSTASTPMVVGRRLYYVTPAGKVICADAENGKIQWRYDMVKELQVHPGKWFCEAPTLPSLLVLGNLVFAVTGNGTDDEGKLPSPKAPSFIALDKRTGKLAWQCNLPGGNIIDGQWSSPTFANQGGTPQVILAGGDCLLYSFAPETGKLLWKCDCPPTLIRKGEKRIDLSIVGTPVVHGDKLYVGLGNAPLHPLRSRSSYFLCADIARQGAVAWVFGGPIEPRPKKGRRELFGPTLSTAAVHEGLVYITEEDGYLHCLNAATGTRVWEYDLRARTVGSPYWVDGRVFVGTEDGEIAIFAHGRTAKLLAKIDMDDPIHTTPVAANGTLYVASRSKLFAIGSP